MSRSLVAAFLACSCFVAGAWGVWVTWFSGIGRPLTGACGDWLEQPTAHWLALKGCALGVDELLLESDAGDLETLADRRQGLASKPYDRPPHWVAAWAPVTTLGQRGSLVRAVFRLESKDLLTWLNAFERADDRRREAMWADPVVLRRLAMPGVLSGRATKPPGDAVQKAMGARASGALLLVLPGEAPPPSLPVWAAAAFLAGAIACWLAWREFTQNTSGHAATPEQELTNANVRDVKLDLGALEELRREEDAARRSKPPPAQ